MSVDQRKRMDFITFISDTLDPDKDHLLKDFCSITDANQLYEFFQNNGYHDIPFNDCEAILETKMRYDKLNITALDWKPCPKPRPDASY